MTRQEKRKLQREEEKNKARVKIIANSPELLNVFTNTHNLMVELVNNDFGLKELEFFKDFVKNNPKDPIANTINYIANILKTEEDFEDFKTKPFYKINKDHNYNVEL